MLQDLHTPSVAQSFPQSQFPSQNPSTVLAESKPMASASTQNDDSKMASSSTQNDDSKKVVLQTSDGEIFELDEAVALEAQAIKHMIEDDCAQSTIPLPNVTGETLALVVEFCKRQVENTKAIAAAKAADLPTTDAEDSLKEFYADFVDVDQDILFDLILAANFLNIKSLLDLTCHAVADIMRGKTPEEIRETFGIDNDYTIEEEEEVRKEVSWAFE